MNIILMLFISLGSESVIPQTISGFASVEACEKAASQLAPIYISKMETLSAQRNAHGVALKAQVTHTCEAIAK
ncbi:hypothetical protein SJS42_16880 [Aeromonas caviae]|uniref:hypothetical protein n=1 Tax=Aeromonas caviae TaxID=648 RepID=UPI0029D70347|nr:hypothetical protein [Aeromonas caviae]MDX7800309.1 hypothetical protein [Aeromonas caviae]